MHMKLPLISVCFLIAFFSGPFGLAQVNEVVDVALVDIYISALDSDRNPVEDLSANDFLIREEGREQPIIHFSRLLGEESQIPLTVVFLVDTSGSMQEGSDKVRRIDISRMFASMMLKEMKKTDQFQVIAFDNIYRALTPMTSDPGVMNAALKKVNIDVHANPGTALKWSVNRTILHLNQFFGRKILIICSDGQDNARGPAPDELVESLKRNDITVLAVAPITNRNFENAKQVFYGDTVISTDVQEKNTEDAKKGRKLIKKMAEESGGYAFFPGNDSELYEAITKIRAVLRSQYALAYVPPERTKPGWRKIDIKCKRKGVKLRYRNGYFND